MADHKKLVDDFGLSVVTWRNAKKGDRREAAHRESITAKKALMDELDGLRRLADEYDARIRHMDAGGDFHEFMAARSREFEQAQQGNAGVPVDAPRTPTDAEVAEWAERHDLRGSATDLRCAFEDAQTLHMAPGVLATDGGQKNV